MHAQLLHGLFDVVWVALEVHCQVFGDHRADASHRAYASALGGWWVPKRRRVVLWSRRVVLWSRSVVFLVHGDKLGQEQGIGVCTVGHLGMMHQPCEAVHHQPVLCGLQHL